MATMRCTTAHWQGHEFIPAGTLIAGGDARFIPEFFVPVEDEAPAPKPRAKPGPKPKAKPEDE